MRIYARHTKYGNSWKLQPRNEMGCSKGYDSRKAVEMPIWLKTDHLWSISRRGDSSWENLKIKRTSGKRWCQGCEAFKEKGTVWFFSSPMLFFHCLFFPECTEPLPEKSLPTALYGELMIDNVKSLKSLSGLFNHKTIAQGFLMLSRCKSHIF